jgi:hypothetical protein
MILVRDVFQAKYGHGDELVRLFKEMTQELKVPNDVPFRVLTDLSGPFFTVVTEYELENLAAWEGFIANAFSDPKFGEWFGRMMPLVETGRREFYTIET